MFELILFLIFVVGGTILLERWVRSRETEPVDQPVAEGDLWNEGFDDGYEDARFDFENFGEKSALDTDDAAEAYSIGYSSGYETGWEDAVAEAEAEEEDEPEATAAESTVPPLG